MNPQHYATRARVALIKSWPELQRYDQSIMLRILGEACTTTELLEDGRQCGKIAPGLDTIPPAFEAVAEFLKGLQSDLDPQDFMDHYQSNGWLVGRVKMKDWRSAARRAHRLWQRPGQRNAGGTAAPVKLTEWERRSRMDRLKAMQAELHELQHPGGSAYPVYLAGAKSRQAAELIAKIAALKKELEE